MNIDKFIIALESDLSYAIRHGEEVSLRNYRTLADVYKRIPFFIQEVYNKKRLYSSLGYLPPDEFESNFIEKEQGSNLCQLVTT